MVWPTEMTTVPKTSDDPGTRETTVDGSESPDSPSQTSEHIEPPVDGQLGDIYDKLASGKGEEKPSSRSPHVPIASPFSEGAADNADREKEPHPKPTEQSVAKEKQRKDAPAVPDDKSKKGEGDPAPPPELLGQATDLLGQFKRYGTNIVTDDKGTVTLKGMTPQEAIGVAKERATNELKRANWTDDQIAELPDPLLLKVGNRVAKKNIGIDRDKSELAQLRRQMALIQAEDGDSTPPVSTELGEQTAPAADPAKPAETIPAADATKPAAQEGESVDDILASIKEDENGFLSEDAVKEAFRKMVSRGEQNAQKFAQEAADIVAQRYEERIADMQSTTDAMQVSQDTSSIRAAIAELNDPNLQGPENAAKADAVLEAAFSLAGRPGADYIDAEENYRFKELVDEAYMLAHGKEYKQTIEAEIDTRYKDTTQGHVGVSDSVGTTPAPASPKAMTPSEQMYWTLDRLEAGDDPKQVAEDLKSMTG